MKEPPAQRRAEVNRFDPLHVSFSAEIGFRVVRVD